MDDGSACANSNIVNIGMQMGNVTSQTLRSSGKALACKAASVGTQSDDEKKNSVKPRTLVWTSNPASTQQLKALSQTQRRQLSGGHSTQCQSEPKPMATILQPPCDHSHAHRYSEADQQSAARCRQVALERAHESSLIPAHWNKRQDFSWQWSREPDC